MKILKKKNFLQKSEKDIINQKYIKKFKMFMRWNESIPTEI